MINVELAGNIRENMRDTVTNFIKVLKLKTLYIEVKDVLLLILQKL